MKWTNDKIDKHRERLARKLCASCRGHNMRGGCSCRAGVGAHDAKREWAMLDEIERLQSERERLAHMEEVLKKVRAELDKTFEPKLRGLELPAAVAWLRRSWAIALDWCDQLRGDIAFFKSTINDLQKQLEERTRELEELREANRWRDPDEEQNAAE